jgi:hypothetical protein
MIPKNDSKLFPSPPREGRNALQLFLREAPDEDSDTRASTLQI